MNICCSLSKHARHNRDLRGKKQAKNVTIVINDKIDLRMQYSFENHKER